MAQDPGTPAGERGRDGGRGPGRVPPHDLEAEKAVLSAMLLDNAAVHAVLTEIKPDDFYHPIHRQICGAMVALQEGDEPVDLHTLSAYLNERKLLDAVGGTVYLAELADYEATAANVMHHAKIVRDRSVKRALAAIASEIAESVYDSPETAAHLLDVAQGRVFDIAQEKGRATFQGLGRGLHFAMDHIEALIQRAGELTGVPTGFADLDADTGGLQPGELIVVGARPSMGKTALALNIARNAAFGPKGKKIAIFSLEMTTLSLVLRLLSAESRVDLTQYRKGYGTTESYGRLTDAAAQLSDAKIWIDDSGTATILEIRAKARRLAAEHDDLDLVIVDYLQLVRGDSPKQRKDLELGEVSAGLKSLAKELHAPVVALSQLNRGPEQRDPDKRRPNMGDLRESGAIEQDADVIAFIYRDEVYNPDSEHRGIAELIIAKQRNGPTGVIKLHFEPRYATFRDLAPETRSELGMPADPGFAAADAGGRGGDDDDDDFGSGDPPF